eukprot:gene41653-50830_t
MTSTALVVSKTVGAIVENIKNGTIRNIVVLTGAGISCAAGIPDFRSPGGLYATLRPELITATEQEKEMMRADPTAVVNIRLFRQNQFPYLEVRRPFIIGTARQQWKATLSHYFIKVLHEKGLFKRLYTQNIDGLDFQLDLPLDRVVNVHGSLAEIKCEFCGADYPKNEFLLEIESKVRNIYDNTDPVAPQRSSNILCKGCKQPGVKPATVMYGRQLPETFWKAVQADFPAQVDLLVVVGTSLTVAPACNLVSKVNPGVPRLLINNEMVGGNLGLDFGPPIALPDSVPAPRDGCILGNCDEGFLYLLNELGWLEDIKNYRDRMADASALLLASNERK